MDTFIHLQMRQLRSEVVISPKLLRTQALFSQCSLTKMIFKVILYVTFFSMYHTINTLPFFKYQLKLSLVTFLHILYTYIYTYKPCLLHLQLFICFSFEYNLLFFKTKSSFIASL